VERGGVAQPCISNRVALPKASSSRSTRKSRPSTRQQPSRKGKEKAILIESEEEEEESDDFQPAITTSSTRSRTSKAVSTHSSSNDTDSQEDESDDFQPAIRRLSSRSRTSKAASTHTGSNDDADSDKDVQAPKAKGTWRAPLVLSESDTEERDDTATDKKGEKSEEDAQPFRRLGKRKAHLISSDSESDHDNQNPIRTHPRRQVKNSTSYTQ
ncbi:hypothetical protein MBANPS3_004708, partial [Mucor bainieri]